MGTVLLFGFLTGLDNFQVSAGLGLTQMDRKRKWSFVIAFAFFEALMPWLGLMLGEAIVMRLSPAINLFGPICLAACGAAIIAATLWGRDQNFVECPGGILLLSLPVVLSLDNLLAGAGFGALGFPIVATSLVIGLCSGSMCFAGMFVGDRIGQLLPRKAHALGGVWLLCVACLTLFIGE